MLITGQFRLAQKTNDDSDRVTGRLEIYHAGEWGTICDDDFNWNAAKFVCQQMGYKTGLVSSNIWGAKLDW